MKITAIRTNGHRMSMCCAIALLAAALTGCGGSTADPSTGVEPRLSPSAAVIS